MTREEAIVAFEKQLHSAVAVLDSGFGTNPGECDMLYRRRKEMAEIALAALRAQQEAENEPLTLDELRQMDGEPVWMQPKEKNSGIWGFVDTECGLVRIFGPHERGRTFGICRHFKVYGKTWFAYRRKPEEGTT